MSRGHNDRPPQSPESGRAPALSQPETGYVHVTQQVAPLSPPRSALVFLVLFLVDAQQDIVVSILHLGTGQDRTEVRTVLVGFYIMTMGGGGRSGRH